MYVECGWMVVGRLDRHQWSPPELDRPEAVRLQQTGTSETSLQVQHVTRASETVEKILLNNDLCSLCTISMNAGYLRSRILRGGTRNL